ncbi:MAG: DUF5329 family protein [Halioglobus sp.]
MIRRTICSLLLAWALILTSSASAQTQAELEVNYLLEYVASSGCIFIRNGDDHDSADAADHLRLKYTRGKRYVNSAEQFIDRLATQSSWSGDQYMVTCAGKSEPSGEWLHRTLADYRQQSAAPSSNTP